MQEPIVRVRVARVRGRDGSVNIGRDDQWIRLRRKGGSAHGVVLRGPLSIQARREGWRIRSEHGFRPWLDGFEWFDLTPAEDATDTLEMGERSFPGALRCVQVKAHDEREFDVVNRIAVESYLPGVVGRELFSHWHAETHAAQAVAARSFAAAEHAYFGPRRHYDLADTQRSQVYGGAIRRARVVEAVQATRGRVLAYAGYLVPGYYCACCGGEAAAAVDAIGEHPFNDVPPLAGRAAADVCTAAPLFRWTIERSRSDVLRRIRAFGSDRKIKALASLDEVESIDAAALNPNGRPTRYAVRDGSESIELKAHDLRRAVDFAGSRLQAPKKRLWSSHVQVALDGREATFDGRGHGHGVGLCQYGAEALAQDGEDHDSIVRWYYPGADVVRAYG